MKIVILFLALTSLARDVQCALWAVTKTASIAFDDRLAFVPTFPMLLNTCRSSYRDVAFIAGEYQATRETWTKATCNATAVLVQVYKDEMCAVLEDVDTSLRATYPLASDITCNVEFDAVGYYFWRTSSGNCPANGHVSEHYFAIGSCQSSLSGGTAAGSGSTVGLKPECLDGKVILSKYIDAIECSGSGTVLFSSTTTCALGFVPDMGYLALQTPCSTSSPGSTNIAVTTTIPDGKASTTIATGTNPAMTMALVVTLLGYACGSS